jgi:site-specific recombinase XerD
VLTARADTAYLPLNVGAAVKLQQGKDKLAQRILSETDVHAMLALEPGRRNQVLLRLLYIAGLRVSEIVDLKWRDLQPRTDGGQVTVFGKGSSLVPPSPSRQSALTNRDRRQPFPTPVAEAGQPGHADPGT